LARLHLEDDTHPVREEESTPDLAGRSTLRYNRHAVDEIRDAELRDDLSDVLFVVVVVVFRWRCVPLSVDFSPQSQSRESRCRSLDPYRPGSELRPSLQQVLGVGGHGLMVAGSSPSSVWSPFRER
jgi:hypothetical protein